MSGSYDYTLKIWNLANGAQIKELKGHNDYVASVAISPDGKILASGSGDKTIKIWNLENGAQLKQLKGPSDSIWSVTFSPDGKTLASGSNTIKIWNLDF